MPKIEVDGRSWIALLTVEFFLLMIFLPALFYRAPPMDEMLGNETVTIASHADHESIHIGFHYRRFGPSEKIWWPAGTWIRPQAGDTMFDAQGPVQAALRPWLDTNDKLRVWYHRGSCRPASETTRGGSDRFARVCAIALVEVGGQTIGTYDPGRWSFPWTPFLLLCLWTGLIVYFFRRDGRR
ncbi:MAG: hypothetical protein KKC79_20685 [Gammaproteobacteria bacterium]|nr:hypothetical protein [Gammaproteobacteria bacterium]MBU1441507.1 hypothetical protein [Gammaproteobacteria bacterium]MBU2286319.1 hypothetical protein [Gammaproteobacteria bacterium]MBU2411053.1 hypothetical protein [Gammaproteobacteria bacterium]